MDPSSCRLGWQDQSPIRARFPYLAAHPGGTQCSSQSEGVPVKAPRLGSRSAGHHIKGDVFKERQVRCLADITEVLALAWGIREFSAAKISAAATFQQPHLDAARFPHPPPLP